MAGGEGFDKKTISTNNEQIRGTPYIMIEKMSQYRQGFYFNCKYIIQTFIAKDSSGKNA